MHPRRIDLHLQHATLNPGNRPGAATIIGGVVEVRT
jgi:hypothetical protein